MTQPENMKVLVEARMQQAEQALGAAEKSPQSPVPIPLDSNVEMTWQVFGGPIADLLLIALKQRCHDEGLDTDQETLAHQLRLHLHRGIGYLAGDSNIKTLEDMISLTL